MGKTKRGCSKRRGRPAKSSESGKTRDRPAENAKQTKPRKPRQKSEKDKPVKIAKKYCGQQIGKRKITK